MIGHVEDPECKTYLRSKMRVLSDERELYFLFSVSHLSPVIWVLAFGYVLISAAFVAEALLRSIPKLRTCGLAGVCTVMLRWAQNKPIHLMLLWC